MTIRGPVMVLDWERDVKMFEKLCSAYYEWRKLCCMFGSYGSGPVV